jgi:hypothetical protein
LIGSWGVNGEGHSLPRLQAPGVGRSWTEIADEVPGAVGRERRDVNRNAALPARHCDAWPTVMAPRFRIRSSVCLLKSDVLRLSVADRLATNAEKFLFVRSG